MKAVEKAGLYVRISEQDKIKLTKVQLSKSIENQLKMMYTVMRIFLELIKTDQNLIEC